MTNYSTAVMLINENIKAIKVTYEPDDFSTEAKRTMYKTADSTLKVGDLVIVPTKTRHLFTVAKVDEIDVEVDFESSVQVDWVAGNAPVDEYDAILGHEKEMIDVIRAAENKAKRDEMRARVVGLQEDSEITNLAITSIGAVDAEAIEEE